MWETEIPTSLGVCTCNIFNGLTPASLRGDAAVSYGADACNTTNYINTLLMVFALIAVYVLPLPELMSYICDGRSVSKPNQRIKLKCAFPSCMHLGNSLCLRLLRIYHTPYITTCIHTLFTYGCIVSSLTISLVSRAPFHPFTQSLLRRHRRVCRADAVQGRGRW